MRTRTIFSLGAASVALAVTVSLTAAPPDPSQIGKELSVPRHLADGEEFTIGLDALLAQGRNLFIANWTNQEGGGRPLTKGTGAPVSDPTDPLNFPRNFNRVSAPDANSCAGCHNLPMAGGAGDFVANVFVLGQRFDFATFDSADLVTTKGTMAENGSPATLSDIANSRATTSMAGSGYLEMLAREMSLELRAIRATIPLGGSAVLSTKGINFGTLTRRQDGSWDASRVVGLPAPSVATPNGAAPSLIVMPWHQAGAVISVRQFTNNAMNHHHGIQTTERFGVGTDPDGDGFINEMTRADVTAATIWQIALPVPGRVIPHDPQIETAIWNGEQRFEAIGCASCHVPELPLSRTGRFYEEPNRFNPSGNLRPGDAPTLTLNLNDLRLPKPRLRAGAGGVTMVPAYTDLRLHDITSGPDDPNREALNMHFPAGSTEFFEGNSRFLTKRLWGAASEPPYFHHGKYTTLREATLAHAGEALTSKNNFLALSATQQDEIIEFMKSLQILPQGVQFRIVDENFQPRTWPPQ